MNVIDKIEKDQMEKISAERTLPEFGAGDTLKVDVKIVEGDKERVQAFEGLCIARSGGGLNENFTVRKISYGEGVERIFPIFSPKIAGITVLKRGKVRRAKLYYLRDRTGKSARIAEKIRKKIGIDVDVKPETVTEENVAPPAEAPKEEAPAAEAPKAEATPAAEAPKEEQKTESTSEKK